ncbi:hypothetical protein ABZX51_008217 [Aspergillus tubingensis]
MKVHREAVGSINSRPPGIIPSEERSRPAGVTRDWLQSPDLFLRRLSCSALEWSLFLVNIHFLHLQESPSSYPTQSPVFSAMIASFDFPSKHGAIALRRFSP